jgi:preprotein translocase subunit SecG
MMLVLLVIHMMIAAALVGIVLVQKSEGGALGIGGGGGGLMSGRGQANFLTRTTSLLGAAFFATSLALTVIANQSAPKGSVLDKVDGAAPAATAPAKPGDKPADAKPAEGGPTLLDKLKSGNAPLDR